MKRTGGRGRRRAIAVADRRKRRRAGKRGGGQAAEWEGRHQRWMAAGRPDASPRERTTTAGGGGVSPPVALAGTPATATGSWGGGGGPAVPRLPIVSQGGGGGGGGVTAARRLALLPVLTPPAGRPSGHATEAPWRRRAPLPAVDSWAARGGGGGGACPTGSAPPTRVWHAPCPEGKGRGVQPRQQFGSGEASRLLLRLSSSPTLG